MNSIKINKDTSKTICPLPFMSFYGTASGKIVACCESQETILSKENETFEETWNNDTYKKLRKALINGDFPDLCKKCWRNEEEGQRSNRQQSLDDLENGYYGDIKIAAYDDGTIKSSPSFLELKPSNICNLKCLMCHPESSHRIYEDKEIISKYRKGLPWNSEPLKSTKLFNELKNAGDEIGENITILQYSGGEPLISNEQYDLTSHLAQKYGQEIQLRYSTNLNNLTFEKYDVIELWKKYRSVNVKISADGVFDVYDYIRKGGDFDILVKNLDTLKGHNLEQVQLGFGFTTQIYNIFQLPETLDFFTKYVEHERISTHLLYTPRLFCIEIMPPKLCERIIKKLKQSVWDFSDKVLFLENIIETDSYSENKWNTFLQYTSELEKKYNIDKGYDHLVNKYLDGF